MACLLELERLLSAKDSVLERNTIHTLREYVAAGGKPETAIDLLSDNYRGARARACVCRQTANPYALSHVASPRLAPAGYAQMTSLVCKWLEGTDASGSDAVRHPRGDAPSSDRLSYEYRFAEALVRARFDGQRVDEEMGRLRAIGKQPQWFLDLMDCRTGRSLLYSLAEQHRSCTTLGIVISLAWQRGHEDEVAILGATAAASFDIFHGVLRRRLDEILTASTEQDRDAAVEELRRLCIGSPATYLFTQMLLCRLSGEPGGAPLRRISHELETAAVAARGASLLRGMAPLLARSDADTAALSCTSALLAASERGANASASAEVAQLWKLYSAHGATEEAGAYTPMETETEVAAMPSLEPLRLPSVVHALLREAFWPGRAVPVVGSGGALPPAFELLALGCSARTELDATRAAMLTSVAACERASQGAPPDEEARAAFAAAPVAAAGAVAWARRELGHPDYYRRVEAQPSHTAYVALLAAVADCAPTQCEAVTDALAAALRAVGRGAPERSEQVLKLAPILLRAGCVQPLLAAIERWAPQADPSLVRTFITSALEVAAPPYSRAFASALLRLCAASGMRRAGLAAQFTQEVVRASKAYQPPLSAEEQQALNKMLSAN